MDADPSPLTRAAPVLLALAAAIALLLLVLSQITVRTDMTEFLPQGDSPAARLVLGEVRSGAATGLILIGLDGDTPEHLARISRTMVTALTATGLFQLVAGGQAAIPETALNEIFARRYLLADADWSESALHAGLTRLLAQLRGAAAPLAVQFGLKDPPGAATRLAQVWTGGSAVRSIDGAWFAPDRDRALLLARTKAGGMDVPAQEAATAAIDQAFRAADPGPAQGLASSPARLLVAGPAIFARDAARAIKGDVERLSIISTLLVAALLWWRFRSPLVIAAIAAPVTASVAIAAAAVQLAFGTVHGVALGFGATMLGISVDYPVLMLGHRKRGEPAPATRARIGRAFILAVATATIGLAAMTFSGFPGLVQLGLFAAVGLVACAMLTWFALPGLIVRANLAPVSSGDPAWLGRIEALRRYRGLALLPIAAAALYLLATGGPRWQNDLAALSPIPEASRALDQELRAELGAPDAGQLILVQGPDPETVLQRQEALLPVLDRLAAQHVLAGADAAARLLPSAARQRQRQAAIPDPATLRTRLDAASANLLFRPAALAPFLTDAEASRTLAPATQADLAATPAGARLDPLLFQRDGEWRGPIILRGVTDPKALAAALPPGTLYLDTRSELGAILSRTTTTAWRWLAASFALMLVIVAAGLRDLALAARILAAVLAALFVTTALLTAAGAALSLIHLVALQLVAGVGLDYALFFARRQLDAEERARTLRTLVTCNAMTLLTFGLLATCQTPLLRDIGITVACGALLAMAAAFFIAGERS